MEIHSVLTWTGCILTLCLYFPLLKGILTDKVEQSFATWSLWVALDIIALASIIVQKGNFGFLVLYIAGGSTMVIALVMKRQFKWTKFESFALFLVFICLGIWYVSGPKMATIASTLAVVIAGIPQFKDSWIKPDKMTGLTYAGYVLANGLFFFAGKDWSIKERFYAGCCMVLAAAIASVALLRKPKLKKTKYPSPNPHMSS
jgi:hypothetical protein